MAKKNKTAELFLKKMDDEFDEITSSELKKGLVRAAIFAGSFAYLEFVFHTMLFHRMGAGLWNGLLSSMMFGVTVSILCGLWSENVNRWVGRVLLGFVTIYYMVQFVYYHVFQRFLNFFSIGAVGTDVFEFSTEIRAALIQCLGTLFLLLVPLAAVCFLHKLSYKKDRYCIHSILIMIGLSLYFIFLVGLKLQGTSLYSAYDLYHFNWVQDMGVEKLGLLKMAANDFRGLMGENEELELETVTYEDLGLGEEPEAGTVESKEIPKKPEAVREQPESVSKVTNREDKVRTVSGDAVAQVQLQPTKTAESEETGKTDHAGEPKTERNSLVEDRPNILPLDFDELISSEKNKTVQTLHQYFSEQQPTNKNEYTGKFEGYNLILLTAEGFSPWAVDDKITPTLYRLTHEGFQFRNFYTPLWWCSTSDGEYVACTSTIPKSGVTSMFVSGSNDMPFCLGNQFGRSKYQCFAYHNHTYTYYHRDVSHPNMGYEYKGVGNGLELKNTWPESDYEMMVKTIPEYIGQEPFHVYYMTVSGHMNYTFLGNSMSYKNRDAVKDLPYSEEAKAYIACNVELDHALEYLIEELEKAGVADRTVIALSADHYPYGLEKDKIDEIAGHEVEENFELYKNYFILWNPQIAEPIVVEKACSSLDILPTLSNLFGLEYDSRLMMGRDILSDSSPLVMFSNRSFITDKVMYNSTNGEITYLTEEQLPEDYITNLVKVVKNKFAISVSVLEQNYYQTLEKQLQGIWKSVREEK